MDQIDTSDQRTDRTGRVKVVLNVILALTALAAVATLILDYGFREPLIERPFLYIAQTVIVAIFILDRMTRLLLARRRRRYLRENWIDFALIAVMGLVALAAFQFRISIVSAGAMYVFITQAYILITLILHGVSINLRFAESGIHPTWLLIGSFVFLCLAGSGLLMLPVATPTDKPITYDEAIFTATSATCVTGLIVRDTGGDFTMFGQAVILALIQIGGLGIMLFGTVLAMLMGKSLSMRHSSAMGQMLATDRFGQLGRIAVFVVAITFTFEIVGAILFYPMFAAAKGLYGSAAETGGVLWYSIFHSISSFCNAGFSLFDKNMMQGVESGSPAPLRDHWQIFGVMAPLIVLGGLGFPVLQDCAKYVTTHVGKWLRRLGRVKPILASDLAPSHLSLHTKIVLAVSTTLIVVGAAVLLLIEPPPGAPAAEIGSNPVGGREALRLDDWQGMQPARRIREATFQSITARTAGFNTINVDELSDGGKMWICGLMTIGGSPAGTAGGMKTVTFSLLILSAYCVLRRRKELEVFKRSISVELFRRTAAVAVMYAGLVCVITILLCVAMQPGYSFINLLFEACSACGTVGLSTGVTSSLNLFGKLVIVAGMFIGRIGPLTLLLVLTSGVRHVRYAYPTEPVVIG